MLPDEPSRCDACVLLDERMGQRGISRSGRRRWIAGLAGLLIAPWWARRAMAADVEVPIPMQVELMAKVVKYDRNAAARMENGCNLLIVRRANDNASSS